MNKAELINAVAEKAGLSKKDTEVAVNSLIEVITAALKKGDKVPRAPAANPRPRIPSASPPLRSPFSRPARL